MIYIYCPSKVKKFFYLVMNALSYELTQLNYPNQIVQNLTVPSENKKHVAILFGYHCDTDIYISSSTTLKKYISIAYNSEQLQTNVFKYCIHKFKNVDYIWDYSQNNINILNKYGYTNVSYVPLGYSESYKVSNINDSIRDFTQLTFFGCENQRRLNLISKIRKNGQKVYYKMAFNNEYNQMLRSHGLYMNIHYYLNPVLEAFRIVPLLSNNCAVLSETSDDHLLDDIYGSYLTFFDPNGSKTHISSSVSEAISERETRYANFKQKCTYRQFLLNSGCLNYLTSKQSDMDKRFIAKYGIIDDYFDVTPTLQKLFKKGDLLIIPRKTSFNDCFGDTHPTYKKNLILTIGNNQPIILGESSPNYSLCYNLKYNLHSDIGNKPIKVNAKYGFGIHNKNVSKIVIDNFLNIENEAITLKIPSGNHFNQYFGDPLPNKQKELILIINDSQNITIPESTKDQTIIKI